MLRICHLLVLAALLARGQPPPVLVPFDDWLTGAQDTHIGWTLHVQAPLLTETQRLETSVVATVDAKEMGRRNHPGQLLFFVEIRDTQNRNSRIYRPLTPVHKNPNPPEGLQLTENFCVLPGDYEIFGAVYDTLLKQHSLRRARLHVPELNHDPLPGAWTGLPAVQEERACSQANISLPVHTEKPVVIDLIVNRPLHADTNVDARLRILSELALSDGSMRATAVDLANRRERTRPVIRRLNRGFWAGFPGISRYMVDAHALDEDRQDAQFFVSAVAQRLKPAGIVIILSEPRTFPKNEDLRPIEAAIPSGAHVFYLRSNPVPNSWLMQRGIGRGSTVTVPMVRTLDNSIHMPAPPPPERTADSMERLFAPLHPRLFDVSTAAEFRRALAEIIAALAQPD